MKYHEDITEGFDNMFDAFAGLFTGKNLGKAVVKAQKWDQTFIFISYWYYRFLK